MCEKSERKKIMIMVQVRENEALLLRTQPGEIETGLGVIPWPLEFLLLSFPMKDNLIKMLYVKKIK